jgi:hypothetical protein
VEQRAITKIHNRRRQFHCEGGYSEHRTYEQSCPRTLNARRAAKEGALGHKSKSPLPFSTFRLWAAEEGTMRPALSILDVQVALSE